MLPFNSLGISFTNGMHITLKVTFISTPTIAIEMLNPKWGQQLIEFHKCFIVMGR
jgi:hypothetical protein